MKKCVFIIIFISLLHNEMYSQDVDFSKYKIVNLNREDSSIKVLEGVANVRFRATKDKDVTLAMTNNDFKIIGKYMTDSRKVSNQIERFNKYSKEQQKRILDLEDVLSRTFVVEVNPKMNVLKFCKKMLQEYDIEVAEPHYVDKFLGTPNDPEVVNQEVLTHIKAFEGWEICEGDSTLLIGVGDTGFNINHTELKEQIVFNEGEIPFNGIDDDGNGYIDDYTGYNLAWKEDFERYGSNNEYEYCDNLYHQNTHGMNVIGIIGARTNNEFGIAGVANKCKLVPIKIQSMEVGYLYSYQSILYAAVRGCKVLNCSWGMPKSFSVVDQSIIDYAIACDVAIVAAAGNMSSQGVTNQNCIHYPSSYYGVLGVGGSNPGDVASLSGYVLGPGTRILAQARAHRTLGSGDNQIITSGNGTSFASPVVAGVLGIVRSYKPELSPQEAIELVRTTADSITGSGGFVPNRVNMYRALTTDADLTPSIILKEKYYETLDGIRIDKMDLKKWNSNDTFNLVLKVKNILGDAKNINVSFIDITEWYPTGFNLLDTTMLITELKKNNELEIKAKINIDFSNSIRGAYYKLQMEGENKQGTSFKDNFNFYIQAITKLNTIENKNMIVTISDNGEIKDDEPTTNIYNSSGLTHKKYGNFLENSFLIVSFGNQLITNLTNQETTFSPLKITLTDNSKTILLKSEYTFPTDTSSALKTKLTFFNLQDTSIKDLALGQLFDFDINNYIYNKTEYFEAGIPDFLDKNTATAQITTDMHESVFIGSLAFVNKNKLPDSTNITIPQAAGGSNLYYYEEIYKGINSGIERQSDDIDDMEYIVGMKFYNEVAPNDSIECIICTGYGTTRDELANTLMECAKSELVSISHKNNNECKLNLIGGILNIQTEFDNYTLEIYDNEGKRMLISKIVAKSTDIDISNFLRGVYWIRLNNNAQTSIVRKIIY